MIKKVFTWGCGFALLALVAFGLINRQQLRDRYIAQTATQQPAASELLPRLELTDKAEVIYRASRPQVQSSEAFNSSCKGALHTHSIVLGCYTRQQIFIYDVTDERLDGVKEVTATHELLHAVYERLSGSEKDSLNAQLRSAADSIRSERLQKLIDEYRSSGEAVLTNELHSILGTELAVLPSGLEEHYSKYFRDRQKIVQFAQQYEETFEAVTQQIDDYDQQLKQLKDEKATLESSLSNSQGAIEREQERLNQLQHSGQIEAYNRAVPGYNERIRAHNVSIAELKRLIEQYNTIVEQRNALASTQNDLVQQLDSSYEAL